VAGATAYKIFRSTTSAVSGFTLYNTTSNLSYVDNALVSGSDQWYKLITVSGANESVASDVVTEFYIAQPTGVATVLNTTPQTITVNWNAVTGADSYKIYRSTISSGTTTFYANAATNTYTDSALVSDTTHYYYVVAYNGSRFGLNSSTVSRYFIARVTDLAANLIAAESKIDLTWSAIGGATSYNVFRSNTSGTTGFSLYASAPTNTFTDTTLQSGEDHWYKVVTVAGANLSADSNVVYMFFISEPSGLLVNLDEVNDKIDLDWITVVGADSYEVYRSITGVGNLTYYALALSNTYQDLTPSSGNTHDYAVKAKKGANTSLISSSVSKYFLDNVEDLGILVDDNAATIDLSWSVVQGVANYLVYRSDLDANSGFIFQASVTGTTYQDTSMVSGVEYFYHVINESSTAQVSIKSNVVSGTYTTP
jgi:fibronectin type 3 domain-containing protein